MSLHWGAGYVVLCYHSGKAIWHSSYRCLSQSGEQPHSAVPVAAVSLEGAELPDGIGSDGGWELQATRVKYAASSWKEATQKMKRLSDLAKMGRERERTICLLGPPNTVRRRITLVPQGFPPSFLSGRSLRYSDRQKSLSHCQFLKNSCQGGGRHGPALCWKKEFSVEPETGSQ